MEIHSFRDYMNEPYALDFGQMERLHCMDNGINYYDTAYGYHGGQSELVVGELMKAYDRDSFYLAYDGSGRNS